MQTVKTSGRGGAARRVTSIRIHRTKLVAPPRPPSFVRRARLDELVTRSVEQPLIVDLRARGDGEDRTPCLRGRPVAETSRG